MRKIAAVFFLALLLSGVCAFSQEQAPTFEDGEFWQFRMTANNIASSTKHLENAIYELGYSQDKVTISTIKDGQRTQLNEGDGKFLLGLLGLSRARPNIKFPLSVGQKWTYDYNYQPPGSRRPQTRSVEVRVVGIEHTTVPAGNFRTVKLSSEESWLRAGARSTGFSKTVFFYSPDTKSIVRLHEEQEGLTRDIELVKFGRDQK